MNFLHWAEQGITPSEAVPSLVDLEPAAGNDSNNTLIWTWHDNEPAAIAGTTMTAEYKPNQIWVLNRSETDRKEVWSWTKQGSSGNQGSNKQWRQQHIDPNCGNWGSQHSSGNQGDLMGNLLSTLSSPPGCPPPLTIWNILLSPRTSISISTNSPTISISISSSLLMSYRPKLLYTMHYILVINSEDTVCSIQFKAGKIPALRGILETCGTFGNVSSQKKQCLLAWAERGIASAAIKRQDWLSSDKFWTI